MSKWSSPSRLLIFGSVIALGLLIPLWWARNPAPVVQAVEARRGPLVIEVSTNGTVEPIDDIEVRAAVDARVVEIPDAGKIVRKGEEVVRLDIGAIPAELAAAKSEHLASLEALRAARDAVARSRQNFAVDEELFKGGALTTSRYKERKALLREVDAKAESLEHEVPLRVASLDLRIAELERKQEAAIIRAPFDGTVYKTAAKKGQKVNVGDALLSMADLVHLRIRANVDQVDLGKVEQGQRIRVLSNAHPGRVWGGKVTEVIPNIEIKQNRAIAEALAEVEPPVTGLVPGMTVDVDIVVAEADSVLQIPAEAISNDGKGPFVYKVEGNHVRVTLVQLGLTSVNAAEITAGLEAGDRVVRGPLTELSDGMRVDTRGINGGES
jgi:RND family efflux transporter MFP subunit